MALIFLSLTVLVMWVLIVLLYRRIKKIEKLLRDVSLDINIYEQMKRQIPTRKKKPINKVGTWKK